MPSEGNSLFGQRGLQLTPGAPRELTSSHTTKRRSVYHSNKPARHSGNNPVDFSKHAGYDGMSKPFSEGKDRGVTISNCLSRDALIHSIVAKANKLLGLQKRSCPLTTDVNVRRTLYCCW